MEKNYVSLTIANFKITLKKFTKNQKKSKNYILAQNCLKRIMSQLLDYTNKKIQKSRKNRKLFFGQNCLKQIMITPKKLTNIEKKFEKLFFGQNYCMKRIMSQLLDFEFLTPKN